jgi:hypothetical protein
MNHKKHPFILDNNLNNPQLNDYLPRSAKTTVECGLKPHDKDPLIVELCQRNHAILVTADLEFLKHFHDYQRSHNRCCWGLVMLPGEKLKQVEVLNKIKKGKLRLRHDRLEPFTFEDVRQCNLYVNLRADPPQIDEICDCEWIG